MLVVLLMRMMTPTSSLEDLTTMKPKQLSVDITQMDGWKISPASIMEGLDMHVAHILIYLIIE